MGNGLGDGHPNVEPTLASFTTPPARAGGLAYPSLFLPEHPRHQPPKGLAGVLPMHEGDELVRFFLGIYVSVQLLQQLLSCIGVDRPRQLFWLHRGHAVFEFAH